MCSLLLMLLLLCSKLKCSPEEILYFYDKVLARNAWTCLICRALKESFFSNFFYCSSLCRALSLWFHMNIPFDSWQCISPRGNLTSAPQGVRLGVRPHFGASSSETGPMSHQPMSNVPLRTLKYLMTAILSKREVQQSLQHTTPFPAVALFCSSDCLVVTITLFDKALPTLAQEESLS